MSSPSSSGCHGQTLVFVDTNTLHYVDLYLRQAKHCHLYPYAEHLEKPSDHVCQAGHVLEQLELRTPDKKLLEGYQKGVRALIFLCKHKARVQYSPMSELELSVGRVQGKALLATAGERVPDRMWKDVVTSEKEVALRISSRDLQDTRMEIMRLVERLEDVNIEVMENNSGPMREVWDIARGITGLLYMSAADCIIFASALAAGAAYLLTTDVYLRGLVNSVHNPNDDDAKATQAEMRELVGRITSHDPSNVKFPEAPQFQRKDFGRPGHEG